jgi:hypothetical protein
MFRARGQIVAVASAVRLRPAVCRDIEFPVKNDSELRGMSVGRIVQILSSREEINDMRFGFGKINGYSAWDLDFGEVHNFYWKNIV